MKKFLKFASLALLIFILVSCDAGSMEVNGDMSKVKMTAEIKAVGETLEVEVIEGEYGASGIFWVIIADFTNFYDADGTALSRSDIKIGDRVEIRYGGQVMMSYPPQIVAHEIRILK